MKFELIWKDHHSTEIERYFDGKILSETPNGPNAGDFTIVCFTNRCGSTLVCSVLSQLALAGKPNRFLNYEYLNCDAVISESRPNKFATFEDYLDHCRKTYQSEMGHFAVKASVFQLNWLIETRVLSQIAARPNFIWVRRKNVIAQAISFWTALQDRRWTSLHEPGEGFDLKYSEEKILEIAKSIHEQNAIFQLMFDYYRIEPLEILYEDIESDPERLVNLLSTRFNLLARHMDQSTLPVLRQSSPTKAIWEDMIRANGHL